ncbi:hypothetical protein H0H87_005982 [Tephrocybe sp. NHM501043]|nr:hypothetical protein H0H87_005982 [Tephrocybe sp. NHM501043]
MREKPGGVVTGALFSIARKLRDVRPALLEDARPLALSVGLVGVTGGFILPQSPVHQNTRQHRLLWIAGGIGVTPFLAMLRGLNPARKYDIRLILSTREPDTIVPLLEKVLASRGNKSGNILIEVFSQKEVPALEGDLGVVLRSYGGRITRGAMVGSATDDEGGDVREREVYLCGPQGFEEAVLNILGDLGVEKGSVRREGFEY